MINNDIIYLNTNNELKEKVISIINEENNENAYRKCQALLEYINIKYIEKNIKLKDSNINTIMEEYRKKDTILFEQMVSINAMYNKYDTEEVTKEKIEYLLLKIDYIYGYMKNNNI